MSFLTRFAEKRRQEKCRLVATATTEFSLCDCLFVCSGIRPWDCPAGPAPCRSPAHRDQSSRGRDGHDGRWHHCRYGCFSHSTKILSFLSVSWRLEILHTHSHWVSDSNNLPWYPTNIINWTQNSSQMERIHQISVCPSSVMICKPV